ncbi:hypothetical protein [Bacillus litorisediminis]|uniref:hypothetical protein n=1 Tax=Bacillus litorisediminis TaxID=2922713 RepID=UPI001FAECF8D|nr:hypothetical protein [Bacillus litorisediminis]
MIPNKVKVAGIEYETVYKDFIEINGDRNYQGSCDYLNTQIDILQDLSETKKEQVFVHELIHAVFHEAGFKEQDEDMVNRLGIVLYQVLKDNHLYFGEEIVN